MKELLGRCQLHEGDPRGWSDWEPTDGDTWDLQEKYSYCKWVVTAPNGELRANAFLGFPKVPIELPFIPRFVPEFGVASCVGSPPARLKELPKQEVSAVEKTGDGYLVGYDSGEWGGGLYFYDPNGALVQQVLDENVERILPTADGMIALTGIAHMMTNRGRLHVLTREGPRWRVLRSLDVLGAPQAVLTDSDASLLVASSEHLVRVTDARRVEWLHTSDHGWVAHSLVKTADGTLYLGASYFVVKLTPAAEGGYVERWLAPEGVTRSRPPEAER